MCKRDPQELVGLSLFDTNEGPSVELDFWVLRLGGRHQPFVAAGVVRLRGKAGVLYSDLYGKRVQRRGKREEGTRGKQGQGGAFD